MEPDLGSAERECSVDWWDDENFLLPFILKELHRDNLGTLVDLGS
jgi:hypothetical protein